MLLAWLWILFIPTHRMLELNSFFFKTYSMFVVAVDRFIRKKSPSLRVKSLFFSYAVNSAVEWKHRIHLNRNIMGWFHKWSIFPQPLSSSLSCCAVRRREPIVGRSGSLSSSSKNLFSVQQQQNLSHLSQIIIITGPLFYYTDSSGRYAKVAWDSLI